MTKRMIKIYQILFYIVLALLVNKNSFALPIAFTTFLDGTRTVGEIGGSLDFSMSIQSRTSLTKFFSKTVSVSDVGNTYLIDSGEKFNEISTFLTNGIDDRLLFNAGGYGFEWGLKDMVMESKFDGGNSNNGRDWEGYNIESISFEIKKFGEYSDGYCDGSRGMALAMTINGSIPCPEPSAMLLVSIGLSAFATIRRKKNRI